MWGGHGISGSTRQLQICPGMLGEEGTGRTSLGYRRRPPARPLLRLCTCLISSVNLLIWATSIISGVSNLSRHNLQVHVNHTLRTSPRCLSIRLTQLSLSFPRLFLLLSFLPRLTEPADMKVQVNVSDSTVTGVSRSAQTVENSAKQYPPRESFRINPGTVAPGRLWALRAAGCSCPDPPSPSLGPLGYRTVGPGFMFAPLDVSLQPCSC